MIWQHYWYNERRELDIKCIYAEHEKWDEETLNQLWAEHHICFSGKGAMPIKIIHSSDGNYTVAIGERHEGCVSFHKCSYGCEYDHSFSADEIDSAIEQLQLVKQKIAELKELDKE